MQLPHLLQRAALPSDTVGLARFLLGKVIVRDLAEGHDLAEGTVSGRIVETEAYLVGDAASHAYRGMTPRNRSMFLPRGYAYVYLAYGTSFMLNVSSEEAGIGEAVLIRALEPIAGIGQMERHRGTATLRDLARGPGRLAQALRIDRALDGADLCAHGPLWLGDDSFAGGEIGTSTRIGITKDAERPLRFYLRGSRFVSGAKALNA